MIVSGIKLFQYITIVLEKLVGHVNTQFIIVQFGEWPVKGVCSQLRPQRGRPSSTLSKGGRKGQKYCPET